MPLNRDLGNLIAKAARQVEHLYIEGPALQALTGENLVRGLPAEHLEPALGIVNAIENQQVHQRPPPPGHQPARPAPLHLFFPIEAAASDHHVRSFIDRLHQRKSFLDGRGKIYIAEENRVELRGQHAALHGLSLATVDLVAQVTNILELAHHRLGVVR